MPKRASYTASVILLLLAIPAGAEEAEIWGAMATNVKGDQGPEAANVYGASWKLPDNRIRKGTQQSKPAIGRPGKRE